MSLQFGSTPELTNTQFTPVAALVAQVTDRQLWGNFQGQTGPGNGFVFFQLHHIADHYEMLGKPTFFWIWGIVINHRITNVTISQGIFDTIPPYFGTALSDKLAVQQTSLISIPLPSSAALAASRFEWE